MKRHFDTDAGPGQWTAIQTVADSINNHQQPQAELAATMTVLLAAVDSLSYDAKFSAFESAFLAASQFKRNRPDRH